MTQEDLQDQINALTKSVGQMSLHCSIPHQELKDCIARFYHELTTFDLALYKLDDDGKIILDNILNNMED